MKITLYEHILNIIFEYLLLVDKINYIDVVSAKLNLNKFIQDCLVSLSTCLKSHKGCKLCYGYLISTDIKLETNLFILSQLLKYPINNITFNELFQSFHLLKISNPVLHATNELSNCEYQVEKYDEPSIINFKLFDLTDLKKCLSIRNPVKDFETINYKFDVNTNTNKFISDKIDDNKFIAHLKSKIPFIEEILSLDFVIAGGSICSLFLSYITREGLPYNDIDCFYNNEMNNILINLKKLSLIVESLGCALVFNSAKIGYLGEGELTSKLVNFTDKHSYIHYKEYEVFEAYFIKKDILQQLSIQLKMDKQTRLFMNPLKISYINKLNKHNHKQICKYQFIASHHNKHISTKKSFCSSLLYGFDMSLSQIGVYKPKTKMQIILTEPYKMSLQHKCNFARIEPEIRFDRWAKYTIRYKYPIMVPKFYVTKETDLLNLSRRQTEDWGVIDHNFRDGASDINNMLDHFEHDGYFRYIKYNQWYAQVLTFKSKLLNLIKLHSK